MFLKLNLNENYKLFHSWIEIDLNIIRQNVLLLKKNISSDYMIMVKSNGYGHGLTKMALLAQQLGSKFVGVSFVEEAITLRQNGLNVPILLFTQPDVELICFLYKYKITPVVYSINFLEKLSFWLQSHHKKMKIHVKINTGLNRFGFDLNNIVESINIINNSKNIILEGVFTHFSSADSNDRITYSEFNTFKKIVRIMKKYGLNIPILHASNSAASIWFKKYHLNLIRLGLAVYGLQPSGTKKNHIPIKQSFCWKTKIINISNINKGETVGYSKSWTATRPSIIGVIPVGYSDGFRRTPNNYNYVLCCDKKIPIIGMVMMNHTILDLTEISKQVTIGSDVVLIGKQNNNTITFEDIALNIKTINEEVLTSISPNIPRVYINF